MFGVLGDDLGDSTLGSGLGLCMCHLDTTSGCKLSTTGFLCPQVWVCLFWCIYVKAGINLKFIDYMSQLSKLHTWIYSVKPNIVSCLSSANVAD